MTSEPATKEDLAALRAELLAKIATKEDLEAFATKEDLAALRAELLAKLATLSTNEDMARHINAMAEHVRDERNATLDPFRDLPASTAAFRPRSLPRTVR